MSFALENSLITDATLSNEVAFRVKTETANLLRLGWAIILFGFVGFLAWASFAPLDRGVPLTGTITVESSKKAVQHASGGTVEAILVKEGDRVKAGDPLIRMNKVQASSDAEAARGQYWVAKATEARLQAEMQGKKTVVFPRELLAAKSDRRAADSMALQAQLFQSRRLAKQNEWGAIDESITGLSAQSRGLENARAGKEAQLGFAREQLDSVRALTTSGFIARTRLLDLEQGYAQTSASIAEDSGSIARSKAQIAELRLKRQQSLQEYQKEVQTQLSDVQKEAAVLANRLAGLDHHLGNVVIKSPADGTVIGMAIFTPGAVIAPGFKIMDIVPADDALVVEGRLPVHLVDKIHPGLDVDMIFTAFNQNKTPHIPGTVSLVSADRLTDERSGEPYYRVLAKVAPEGMATASKLKVRAGMPVDLFVKTGERTLMNYLFKPVMDHFSMALSQE